MDLVARERWRSEKKEMPSRTIDRRGKNALQKRKGIQKYATTDKR